MKRDWLKASSSASGRTAPVLWQALSLLVETMLQAIHRVPAHEHRHHGKEAVGEKLRYASQYARSLIEASLDPLVTISPEGKITDVNEATAKVTGVPASSSSARIFRTTSPSPTRPRRV